MTSRTALNLVAVVGVFLGLPLIATGTQRQGNSVAGQKIFAGTCEICHGPTGQGDSSMTGYIKTLPDLAGTKTQEKTDAELRRTLRKGHGQDMVGYEWVFNEAQLDDLIAYIRSLKR